MTVNPKARSRRLAVLPQTLEAIRARGCTTTLINAACHQIRVVGPSGGTVEFFASSEKWYVTRDSTVRGKGVDAMLALLHGLEPPMPTGSAALPQMALFADASFDYRDQTAGWGAWIKTAEMASGRTFWGPITTQCMTSQEAEMIAIASALLHAHKEEHVPEDGVILVQSDCLEVLCVLLAKVPGARASNLRNGARVIPARRVSRPLRTCAALDFIIQFFTPETRRLQLRHVKGHQGNAIGRGWVNKECDRLAKRGRQVAAEARA